MVAFNEITKLELIKGLKCKMNIGTGIFRDIACLNLPKQTDLLTHWGRDKWTPFRRRHFQVHFLEWKCLNSDKISLGFVPKGPINNIPALCQNHYLNQWWLVLLRIYASLGLNELRADILFDIKYQFDIILTSCNGIFPYALLHDSMRVRTSNRLRKDQVD